MIMHEHEVHDTVTVIISIIIDLIYDLDQNIYHHCIYHAVESTVADELIKKLTFTDIDETAKFSNTIRACQFYHPQAFKEPK